MSRPTLFLSAAEISGDVWGARLSRELRRLLPDLRLVGLGGERMAAAGVEVGRDITDTSTIGITDHWQAMPRYVAAWRWARRTIRATRPRAVVVVDAPGVNFPIARFARSRGIPVVYYVTPQTWLWKPGAAAARLRALDAIAVPAFEEEAVLYRSAGLRVIYEGHPLLDDASVESSAAAGAGGAAIGLVPGSRRHGVRRLLPYMIAAARLIRERGGPEAVFVALASERLRPDVEACLNDDLAQRVRIVPGLGAVLRGSSVLLASCGTSLLDAAIAGVPAVACYRLDPVTSSIARHFLRLADRLPAFALPNLIAGEPIVPELIQDFMTAERAARQALRLLNDREARQSTLNGYERVRAALGEPGVVGRVASELASQLRLD